MRDEKKIRSLQKQLDKLDNKIQSLFVATWDLMLASCVAIPLFELLLSVNPAIPTIIVCIILACIIIAALNSSSKRESIHRQLLDEMLDK